MKTHLFVSYTLEDIASAMTNIKDLGENHDELMKDTLDTLLAAPNTEFHQFLPLEKISW